MRIEQYATTAAGSTWVGTERYYYDSANRATRIIRQDADNDTYECRWEYDHNNNVTNLVEIVNGQTHTSAYTYDLEQPISQFVNDGVTWSYTYDADGLRTGRTDGTNTYQYIYAGDKLVRMIYNGEVVDISYAGNRALTYGYDGLRRLSTVSGGIYSKAYTYRDITTTQTTNQVASVTYDLPTDQNFVYTYDPMGNILTYTDANGTVTYAYDGQG